MGCCDFKKKTGGVGQEFNFVTFNIYHPFPHDLGARMGKAKRAHPVRVHPEIHGHDLSAFAHPTHLAIYIDFVTASP